MKAKKTALKIIAIGSIFIFSGLNFTYLVSVSNPKLSGFWMTHNLKLGIAKASAEYDDDDWRPNNSNANTTNTTTSPSGVTTTTPTTTNSNTTSGASGVTGVTPTTTPTVPVIPTTTVKTAGKYVDGVYSGDGYYTYPGGSSTYTVEITVSGGKITSARWLKFLVSGNGLYSQARGDSELQRLIQNQTYGINTFSGATGTSNAVHDAIVNAINKAKQDKTVTEVIINKTQDTDTTFVLSSSQKTSLKNQLEVIFVKLENKLSTPSLIEILKKASTKLEVKISNGNNKTKAILTYVKSLIDIKISEPENKSYIAPNGKTYQIYQLSTGEYIFEREDGTISATKFSTYAAVRNYLYENTLYKEDGIYTAPNGKKYTIIQNLSDLTYKFKREDGSVGINVYTSKDSLISVLKVNNPAPVVIVIKPVVKPIVKTTVPKPIVSTPAPTKTTTVTPVVPKPVVNTPAPVVTTPPVNTKTKAS